MFPFRQCCAVYICSTRTERRCNILLRLCKSKPRRSNPFPNEHGHPFARGHDLIHAEGSKDIQEATGRLRSLQERVAPRVRELREMDEWRRFANAQQQEQLIAMAEDFPDDQDGEYDLRVRLRAQVAE